MTLTPNSQEVPVSIVGSSTYGRYQYISSERTFNMFISDDFLVNFPGYEAIATLLTGTAVGRGLFHSVRKNFIIVVAGTNVYRFDTVGPSSGILLNASVPLPGNDEVVIDENLSSQICFTNGTGITYIYNWNTGNFGEATYPGQTPKVFIRNYVTYQNTYFIFGNGNTDASASQWFVYQSLYNADDATTEFALNYQQTLTLQTKPDKAIAALRIPSQGNNLMVFGSSVAEIWTQVASTQIYQRQTAINIDYGCASISTIANSDEFICWLGINEKSSPSIMVSNGGGATRISSDGIDFFLANIQFPGDSTAFFYRQDGHLFYQLTFFNEADNATITYDFTTQKFFDLTDWDFNFHPARDVVYFGGQTYFVSLNDANLYAMNSDITTYNQTPTGIEHIIPRVRVCDTYRMERPEKFIVDLFTFVLESGSTENVSAIEQCYGYILNENGRVIFDEDDTPLLREDGYCTEGNIGRPRIDVTMSKNGGVTFSNAVPYYLHDTAQYRCQPRFNRLGACNQITMQLRFWGLGRFVIKQGVLEVRQ